MYNDQTSGVLNLTDVLFQGNTATHGGGGIGNYKSSPTLTNVSFSLNTAPNGAGIYNSEWDCGPGTLRPFILSYLLAFDETLVAIRL